MQLKKSCCKVFKDFKEIKNLIFNENVTITLMEVKGEDNHVIRKRVSGLRENYIELVKKIISDK